MAQYDEIATKYVTAKQSSDAVEDIEYHTFVYYLLLPALGIKNMMQDTLKTVLAGTRILDLACGGGYLTRKLKEELGCEEAVGIDISSVMINIARASEEAHPLGITYHITDALNLRKPEKKFDLVVAFYLLNYAKTADELDRMAQVISEQLKDDDHAYFLSINGNVCAAQSIVNTDTYRKYGYSCSAVVPLVDGTPITHEFIRPDGSKFSFTTYYMSPNAYEAAFQRAGFKLFKWVPVQAARDIEWYEEFLKCPCAIGILAQK